MLSKFSPNLTFDIKAGLIISLIALPLSIGIALASGAPPTAGLVAAVIGGIVGGLMGGCELAINGPAAGLIVIVLGAVDQLGHGDNVLGFHYVLGCLVVAGLLQVALGLLKAGRLALAAPTSVVHGMMVGIGTIIMIKQLPVLLGVTPQAKSTGGILLEIPNLVLQANFEIAVIGLASVALLLFAQYSGWRLFQYLPAPLLAVMAGIGLGRYFDLDHEHTVAFHSHVFHVGTSFLLKLPQNIGSSLFGARFDSVLTATGLKTILSIAVVATIESMLSVAAVDRMDPLRRKSGLDRDLVSKGICNTLIGILGGLPVIAEIVRSSANVSSGAKTRWSNVFHGLFLLLFVALFGNVLREIPLSALAGILVIVGWRLAHPRQLLHTMHVGWDQALIFTTTFLLTVFADLLIGVAAGVILEMAINAVRLRSVKGLFHVAPKTEFTVEETALLKVNSPLVFSNFAFLGKSLDWLREQKRACVDLRDASVVDHTALDQLHRLVEEFAERGLELTIEFHESHLAVGNHPLSTRWRPTEGSDQVAAR